MVSGNIARKSNMNGVISSTGTPFGGIVSRVSQASYTVVSPVTADVGNLIIGNLVLDTGRDIVGAMAGIQIRTEATRCIGNTVSQTQERGYPKIGQGIRIADNIHDYEIYENRVSGFDEAIRVENAQWGNLISSIKRNYCFNNNDGILVQDGRGQVLVDDNIIYDCTGTAINIRFAPRSTVKRNKIDRCGTGINLAGGNFYTYFNNRSTIRVGASLEVEFNSINNCTNAHTLTETSGLNEDTLFYGRCKVWRGDTVDGIEVSNRDSDGFPSITGNKKSWNRGDVFYNSQPIPGSASLGSICTIEGTYGTFAGATGSITSGTPDLTVSDSDGLAEGVYIEIAGVSGIKKILTVNGLNITLDSNANATVAGAAITYSVPSFDEIGGSGGGSGNVYEAETQTISGGVVTIASTARIVDLVIDTEGAAAQDTLDTLNSSLSGQIAIIRSFTSTRNIIFDDNADNLRLQGSFQTESVADRLFMTFTGSSWIEIARSSTFSDAQTNYIELSREISAGAISLGTQARQVNLIVDSEGASGADDLDTINADFVGQQVIIRSANNARDITVTENGNIIVSGNSFVLTNTQDRIVLIYDGTNWIQLSASNNT